MDLRAHRPGIIAELLVEYGSAIQGVAYLILRDAADAEEVVMDTLETAWRKADTLRDDAALRTWLLRIATRRSLSKRRRRRAAEPLDVALSVPGPIQLQPDIDRLVVAEALSTLPERMRAAVALRYYAGLSVRQTADVMGTSENTTKTHLRDGIARLRAALEEPPKSAAARRSHDARRV